MLPFGWITSPGNSNGPYRWTNLSQDEQRTQMSLWSMMKSPLMFGGDIIKMDNFTLEILTNQEVLDIDDFSVNTTWVWQKGNSIALSSQNSKHPEIMNVALFNLDSSAHSITISWSDLNFTSNVNCNIRDLWAKKVIGNFFNSFSSVIPSHGVGLYHFRCSN